ncbi:helix-turn-helix domain-containing protein [Streptomyces sp. NPDC002057]|uniref:helix-turn-helix domain-containing protein n=1 Tax=Streptomyces sp. NPDC002057 TaxID=3154664 RepID=UPI00331E84AD
MHVEHLLRLDRLDLALVWGDPALLGQEIGGVTATDLEDPARFLQAGEIVLSGLVWWTPDGDPAKTDRFVAALRGAGAVALLAGEETHGEVPGELVDACRRHRVVLLSVPAHTSFRAITEAVYLRQWGELSRRPTDHYALPENVRGELGRELERGASAGELLDRAFAHLGTPPCYLLTGSGRTVARTATAAELPAGRASERLRGSRGTTLRVEAEDSAFDAWHLHLPGEDQVPPRLLHEIAEILGRHRRRRDRRLAARVRAHEELTGLVGSAYPDVNAVENALRACGLPDTGPYTVVVAAPTRPEEASGCRAALTEALSHLDSVSFAVAPAGGETMAVIAHEGGAGGPLDARSGASPDTHPDGRPDRRAAAHPDGRPDRRAAPHAGGPLGSDPGGRPGEGLDVRAELAAVWPLLHASAPGAAPHAGVSETVAAPADLATALTQARYALAAARTSGPEDAGVAGVGDLSGLATLLAGIPHDVRTVYRHTVLGPLLPGGRAAHATLLDTLEVFLAHNCSWARTAEALHLHVNTVHYRIQRVEALTGRDLSRLDHKLDLRAALLCR